MKITQKLANALMNDLFALAVSANGGIPISDEAHKAYEEYARNKFQALCAEWETEMGEEMRVEVKYVGGGGERALEHQHLEANTNWNEKVEGYEVTFDEQNYYADGDEEWCEETKVFVHQDIPVDLIVPVALIVANAEKYGYNHNEVIEAMGL